LDLSGKVSVKELDCGGRENINGFGSFKVAYETPGVYFCTGACKGNDGCDGISGRYTFDQINIDSKWAKKITNVVIINDANNNLAYKGRIINTALQMNKAIE